MSDYFSLPPRHTSGGGGTPASTPGDDSSSDRSSRYYTDLSGSNDNRSTTNVDLSPRTIDQIPPKDDPKSPYHIGIPVPTGMPVDTLTDRAVGGGVDEAEGKYVREFPTDVLVDRFKKWRKILKGICNYLREVAFAQEQFAKINYQLKGSVKFPFLTDLEEGSNRIIDPFDPKVTAKRQQPLTIAQQREQQQLQQQQEMLQNWQRQQQQQQEMDSQFQQPGSDASYRDFGDDQGIGIHDIQVVKTDSDSAAPSGFLKFGSGSIQDIQVVLKKYHLSIAAQHLKTSKEINCILIPRIEELRRDLQSKIKEIKDLSGDFRTNINEHVAITGQLLNKYISSVKFMNTNVADVDNIKLQKKGTQIKPKHDPYLLKLQLDLQLKRQLLEESYLKDAYVNLQGSGMELEKIVYHKIQQILQRYSSLLDTCARLMIKNLCRELQQGVLSKPPAYEWDKFVGHHPACLLNWKSTDPYPVTRKLSDVVYPQMKSPIAKCIRAGYLSKKSKVLKNYNKGYFVLTSNYLHEFKSSNFFSANQQEDSKESKSTSLAATHAVKTSLAPVMSIALNSCILTEAYDDKFVLVGKPTFDDFEAEAQRLPSVAASSLNSLNDDLKYDFKHGLAHPAAHLSEAPDKITKQTKKTLGKLWKSAKPGGMGNGLETRVTSQKPENNEEKYNYQSMAGQESNKAISWSFRPASSNPSEEELKQFKKWAHDLKNLTTFNNTADRAKFIEERIIKASNRRGAHAVRHAISTPNIATTADGSRLKAGKPSHISLHNTVGGAPAEWMSKSPCNTPAVDDQGNLITVGERKTFGYPMAASPMASPLASPRYSVYSDSSPPSISRTTSQQQLHPQFPPGTTITSKGISPNATVLNAAPVGPPPLNKRSSSGVKFSTPSSIPSAGASVTSAHSGGSGGGSGPSGGGYFDIPVRPGQENSSQLSTPSVVDAPAGPVSPPAGSVVAQQSPTSPSNLARTSSYTAIPKQHASGLPRPPQPPVTQQSLPSSSPIPKVRLNDQELEHVSHIQMPPPAIQPPSLRRHASSGDIPTIKNNTPGAPATSLYQNRNTSQSSLTAASPRTHAIRKHKKNVSFGSLNSLMFSKKGSKAGGNPNTEEFMKGGIQEDEGDDDPQTIKLHRSIYS